MAMNAVLYWLMDDKAYIAFRAYPDEWLPLAMTCRDAYATAQPRLDVLRWRKYLVMVWAIENMKYDLGYLERSDSYATLDRILWRQFCDCFRDLRAAAVLEESMYCENGDFAAPMLDQVMGMARVIEDVAGGATRAMSIAVRGHASRNLAMGALVELTGVWSDFRWRAAHWCVPE